jgi:hypothetical protein
VGAGRVLHGHGLRTRLVTVPRAYGGEIAEVLVRRYVCVGCGAVVVVVPAELAFGHLYTLSVIASALAAWSHGGLSARQVRSRHSAFRLVGASARGWPSLVRWARCSQSLWPRIGPPVEASPRAAAHALCAKLSAFAPLPSGRVLYDAVAGAVHAT